jgi:hypothetical protein
VVVELEVTTGSTLRVVLEIALAMDTVLADRRATQVKACAVVRERCDVPNTNAESDAVEKEDA